MRCCEYAPCTIKHCESVTYEKKKFRSKLGYSCLDKHTKLDKQKTLAYYKVRKLQIHNVFIVQAQSTNNRLWMLT